MALKIFDVTGPTLLEDEPDTGTFDYATINAPVFFCNTVEHYCSSKTCSSRQDSISLVASRPASLLP